MFRLIIIYIFIFITAFDLEAQNLISNPSFSEVEPKKNDSLPYQMLPGNLSNVKSWYLLSFLDYKYDFGDSIVNDYSASYYYSSRDADMMLNGKNNLYLYPKLDSNLGFIAMHLDYGECNVIQQQLNENINKGKYCFKFNYKYLRYKSEHIKQNIKIEFSFSPTDLHKFKKNGILKVPSKLIQVAFKDTINDTDENTPWVQKCCIIELDGSEKYLSIGTLSNNPKQSYGWARYFIDNIELHKIADSSKCDCDLIDKDLAEKYSRNFPINQEIVNDSLDIYNPNNGFNPAAFTYQTKKYLYNIISFMQRNPELKIGFVDYSRFKDLPKYQSFEYQRIERFLRYYNIKKSRISVIGGECIDPSGKYCGFASKYAKFGFKFYKD